MCLASLVGTEVPERLDQMFSTETTDWSVKSLMPSGRMDCCSSSVDTLFLLFFLLNIIIFDVGTQFPESEKNYAVQYKKVQKSPPSQNCHIA